MAKSKDKKSKPIAILRSMTMKFKLWPLFCKPKGKIKSRRRNPHNAAVPSISVPDDASTSLSIPDAAAMTLSTSEYVARTFTGMEIITSAPLRATPVQVFQAKPITSLWYIDPMTFEAKWNEDVIAPRSYSNADATYALTYPPGRLFHEGNCSQENYRMPLNITTEFGLHGVFEPPWMPTERENVAEETFHFEPVFAKRLHEAMPYVGPQRCQNLMHRERIKHGKNLEFLSFEDYPKFAVKVFEKYQFGGLLTFLFTTLKETDIPSWQFSYYKEDWIGIRLGDLASICEMYPPICKDNADRKLTVRIVGSDLHFMLYEVHAGVTEDMELVAAGGVASIFDGSKTDIPPPDTMVLLSNVFDNTQPPKKSSDN